MTTRKPRIVVVGGGFGGLYFVRALRKANVDMILIDRRNFHLFQPLLYQVATASLSAGDIASALRGILRHQDNVTVWLGEVVDIDTTARTVVLADGNTTRYDTLVVATGAAHAYFGHPEWERDAPGLKTIEDALEIRRRFLLAFEAAEREPDRDVRRALTTFVIVGGGPTGVELAGAMAEVAFQSLPRDFRSIDTRMARIILLEGTDRVLPSFPPDLSLKAKQQLETLGVEVRTGAFVTNVENHAVLVGNERIPASNTFWGAGVEASPLGRNLGVPLDDAGRVIVEHDCSIQGHPEVFVIGDLARVPFRNDIVPGVAPGAMQMGRHAARMVTNDLQGKPREPFHYHDKGLLATIGRARAVSDAGWAKFSGFPAWLAWAFIHILYLIGFRNRILVMLQWAWAWFTRQRGIRLITEEWAVRAEREHTVPNRDPPRPTPTI